MKSYAEFYGVSLYECFAPTLNEPPLVEREIGPRKLVEISVHLSEHPKM